MKIQKFCNGYCDLTVLVATLILMVEMKTLEDEVKIIFWPLSGHGGYMFLVINSALINLGANILYSLS